MKQNSDYPVFTVEEDEASRSLPSTVETRFFNIYLDGIKCIQLNKFSITGLTKTENRKINWWKLSSSGQECQILDIEMKEFATHCNLPKAGSTRLDDTLVGNFLVFDFNEANYLKVSENGGLIKVELVNFMAPYPMVQDTNTFTLDKNALNGVHKKDINVSSN